MADNNVKRTLGPGNPNAPTPLQIATGTVETAATITTGVATAPVAGLAGIGQLVQGKGIDSAIEKVERVQQMGTYVPQTKEGQEQLQVVGKTLEPLDQFSKGVGEYAAEFAKFLGADTDTQAAAGAAGETFGDPLDLLGGVGKGISSAVGVGVIAARKSVGKILDAQVEINFAESLEIAGRTPKQIFEETGLYRGPVDKRWRMVISDADATINQTKVKETVVKYANKEDEILYSLPGNNTKLPDVLNHPEMFKKLPFMKDVGVIYDPLLTRNNAFFSAAKNAIVMGPTSSPEMMMKVILHETQHAIQIEHGLTKGGNQKEFWPKNVQEPRKKANDLIPKLVELGDKITKAKEGGLTPEEIPKTPAYIEREALEQRYMELKKIADEARDKYMALGGEAEARAVERSWEQQVLGRSLGDDEYFFPRFPLLDYDMPISDVKPRPSLFKLMNPNRIDGDEFIRQFPEFKGTKVADQYGKPMPVYHGTSKNIMGKFRANTDTSGQLGIHFGTKEVANDRISSDMYAKELSYRTGSGSSENLLPNIHEVYLDIKNPIYLMDKGKWDSPTILKQLAGESKLTDAQKRTIEQFKINNPQWNGIYGDVPDSKVRKLLQDLGYDGVIYENMFEGETSSTSYIVFDPKQIRSAVSGRSE